MSTQTYPSIEHVVIDGASSDGTTELLQAKRSEFSVFKSERDSGVYEAFNKGLRAASGDIIGFLNAGDVFSSARALEFIVSPFANSAIEAVYGDVTMTSEARGERVRHYSSKNFRPSQVKFGFMPAHPTLYLRRSVFDAVGEFDTKFRIAGDFEFVVRAFVNRQTVSQYIPQSLVLMPMGGLSTQGWRSNWRITVEMKRACGMNGLRTNVLLLCARLPVKLIGYIERWR